ncbi:MAG: hypothetical protein Q9181_005928 [Wetmoreana brouardii]
MAGVRARYSVGQLRTVRRVTAQPNLLDLDDEALITETDTQMLIGIREQREHHEAAKPETRYRFTTFPSGFALFNTQTPSRRSSVDHLACAQCERTGISSSYCNVCDLSFCLRCWDMQAPHKRNMKAPGSVPHEKTDFLIAQKIKRALESHVTNEDEVKLLHQKDEDRTWFGILREDGGFPSFQDYGRYANLMAESSRTPMSQSCQWNGTRDSRYPSLVSFVGQTGAGKSTVIKLVIDLLSTQEEENATPVIGSTGENVPTSGDVHLYPDPRTFESDTPILYADCEGLEGGEREPIATRFRNKGVKISKVGKVGSFEKRMQRQPHTSARSLTWADTNAKKTREFAVTNLYPRLLYTFSDVVVFVLKNPRVIESVLEKLVTWAAAALEMSSNQPVLPHAIVVLNASENDIDPSLWDVDTATAKLLQSLSETVSQNAAFKKYALFWRERNRNIRTVEELLLSYYSSFRVVRIPTNGRPNLISEQVNKLYSSILEVCGSSRGRRLDLRMLLDADELQAYLQYAFDHFAWTLETPFDFVKASFTNSPIPLDFGGNILKLAINLMEALPNKLDGPTIFTELSTMVASCIMLDSARHKIRGQAEQIFPRYLEHIEAALENFCDRHWPCEYVKPGGGARCVNVRSGHTKGHQLKSGKVLAVGDYNSRFSFENYRKIFEFDVYSQLTESLGILRTKMHDSRDSEANVAAEIHASTVMKPFHNHTVKAGAQSFISHSTCFSCLFEPPEHALPCGHVLCTPCLRAYGRAVEKYVVEIDGCPIESLSGPRNQVWKVAMKPPDAGIRVLTIDGTGGIIALGLVAKGWSVETCTNQFERLCGKAFTRRVGAGLPLVGSLVSYYNHSEYETRPLEEALVEAYGEDDFLFGGSRLSQAGNGNNVKVAVVATSATNNNLPVVLTNYNRSCSEKRKLRPWYMGLSLLLIMVDAVSYHFQRPEKLESELRIWEAARATSAAPKTFKPFHHKPSKQIYLDGAIYHNNPIQIADKERKNLWPSMKTDYPDVFVSIGTSYGPRRLNRELTSPPAQVGVVSHGKSLYKIAIDHIASALDSEKAWDNYISILQPAPEHLTRYVRLNPQLQKDPPSLDEVECMQMLKATVRSQMTNSEEISVLALQLVASCFYFEKSAAAELQSNDSYECKGKLFKERMVPDRNPAFIIQEKHRAQEAKAIEITPAAIDRMIRKRRFYLDKITINLSSKLAVTEIFLTFNHWALFNISKSPRSLLEDEGIRESTRQITSATSGRWAGRTDSRRARKLEWTPPDLGQRPERTLSSYSQEEHMLADSNLSTLKRLTSLLRKRPSQRKHQERSAESFGPPKPVEYPSPVKNPWGPDDVTAPVLVELDSTPLHFELEGDIPP